MPQSKERLTIVRAGRLRGTRPITGPGQLMRRFHPTTEQVRRCTQPKAFKIRDHDTTRGDNSYGDKGGVIEHSIADKQVWTEPDGTRMESEHDVSVSYQDGENTGSKETDRTKETHPDGSWEATSHTKEYDADGKETGGNATYEKGCAPTAANCTDGETNDKYIDPDSVGARSISMPLTAAEMEQVQFRLQIVSDPSVDREEIFVDPNVKLYDYFGIQGYYSNDWHARFDPDSVTVIAADSQPRFPNVARPDRDPRLETICAYPSVSVPYRPWARTFSL